MVKAAIVWQLHYFFVKSDSDVVILLGVVSKDDSVVHQATHGTR